MKNSRIIVMLVCLLAGAAVLAEGLPRSASPEGAQVYFITPADGAVLTNPIRVVFGLKEMGVAPAGTEKANTGHHHLLVNIESIDMNQPIAKDEQHRHFGGGQTETSIELPPGQHTLQLLLADHLHIPHQPPVMSKKITVTVE